MTPSWLDRLSGGLSRSREQLGMQLNVLLRRGPHLDDEFWMDLEDSLIAADMGVTAVSDMVDRLRREATRQAMPDAQAVLQHLIDVIAAEFPPLSADFLLEGPSTVIVVGVNGTGKTTMALQIIEALSDQQPEYYLSSRVSDIALYHQFPWLKERVQRNQLMRAAWPSSGAPGQRKGREGSWARPSRRWTAGSSIVWKDRSRQVSSAWRKRRGRWSTRTARSRWR